MVVSCFSSGYRYLFKRLKKVISFRLELEKIVNEVMRSGCLK